MSFINTADPTNVILLLTATVLLIYLGRETKRSTIMQITLIVHLMILVVHSIMFYQADETTRLIANSLTTDFGFVAISFFGYLWVDNIEAKDKKKKIINDSLDWLWKKV